MRWVGRRALNLSKKDACGVGGTYPALWAPRLPSSGNFFEPPGGLFTRILIEANRGRDRHRFPATAGIDPESVSCEATLTQIPRVSGDRLTASCLCSGQQKIPRVSGARKPLRPRGGFHFCSWSTSSTCKSTPSRTRWMRVSGSIPSRRHAR